MDQGPLVIEEIEAGAKLIREFDKYEPVSAAFWLKSSDEDQRYLYIASNRIDDFNMDVAYGEVVRLAGKVQSPYFDLFRVKLLNSADPLAKAAVEINSRYPSRLPLRFGGKIFGDIMADDVYIYPTPIPAVAP